MDVQPTRRGVRWPAKSPRLSGGGPRWRSFITACIVVSTVSLINSSWVGVLRPELAAAEWVPFQALLSSDGSGHLFVNNGSEPSWQVCAPDLSNCRPFATGGDVATTGAPSGVVFFWASGVSRAGGGWLSPIWNGNVTSLSPPSVGGTVRANELVTPVPGRWQGGWATDRDAMQLSACANPAGSDCITLTDSSYPGSCAGGSAVLDPVFVGLYLRVADRRFAADTTVAFGAVTSPYGQEAWAPGAITSVAVVGRIGPPLHPRTAKCGPPPLVRATISASAIARVRCGLGCRTSLVAKRAGRKVRRARTLRPFPLSAPRNYPIPELSLPARSLSHLGQGRARVVLLVDGKRVASRTVVLNQAGRPK